MLLDVANLDAFYGDQQALHGLNIGIERGESVALVGANGAGKTTFMRCLAGLIEQKRGAITFDGGDISHMPAEVIARRGIALVPEGRMLFPSLNVEENLLMGALGRRPGYWNLQRVYALFPLLAERRRQMPNTLSGGQQGLVAIGRALIANPDLLLCDEISLGLAPVAIDQIYASFARIRVEGTAIVVVDARVIGDRPHLLPVGGTELWKAAAKSSMLQNSPAPISAPEARHEPAIESDHSEAIPWGGLEPSLTACCWAASMGCSELDWRSCSA